MDIKAVSQKEAQPSKVAEARTYELERMRNLREQNQIQGMKNSMKLLKARYDRSIEQEGVKKISEIAKNMKDISDQLSMKL